MTLDITKPADIDVVSTYAGYERETRAAVNANEDALGAVGAITMVSNVTLNGNTSLTVGVELNDVPLELVIITAVGAEVLNNIVLGTEGQMKILWLYSGSVKFTYNAGQLSNNGDIDFDAATGDVIMYANNNGDGVAVNGYWHEIFRTIRT